MEVELRVSRKPGKRKMFAKKTQDVEAGPLYTPAIIDETKLDFAFIDEDGDINIRYAGSGEYYAIKNTQGLFDTINSAINNKTHKIRGLGK